MQDSSGWARDLRVEVAGQGVVAHTGSVAVRLLADRSGLTQRLSQVLNPKDALILHDRGRVLTDAAVVIADGGRVMSDLAVLRDQDELFGPVASDPTLWRTLNSIDEHTLTRIAAARAKTRVHVWNLIRTRHGAIPAARLAGGEDLGRTIVIRLDATITIAHSDKEQAAGTFKGTFGHHALTAWCDNTDENLAVKFRPGNAGSNTTADHLEVLTEAIRQVPAPYRRDLLITCDGAGSTLDLLHHITELNKPAGRKVHYSVGFDLDTRARTAIGKVPANAWQHVLDTQGQARDLDKAGVVELTGLLRESAGGDRLKSWPEGMRVIVRREKPHPGAQLSLFEELDGWRYQLLATNTPVTTRGLLGQIAVLEARHRAHARVEDRIRTGKNTGLGHFPSRSARINQAWIAAAAMACDLLAWLRLLCLTGPLARAEPKTLRYRILHTSARIIHGQRRRTIRIPETWPWAQELRDCLTVAMNLPLTT
ncbi:IS1380 family transposase [Actinoplanes sp. NPDC049599]|uniref:IS1380 family transposase n=1 Tax=Actinoplanes sp. NPDC049599 TaxID=3363903 RepID=UPI0037B9D233